MQKKVNNVALHCYAIRRVNPFRGVMQFIETVEGRAMSCNGVVWEILVRASQSDTRTASAGENQEKIYYRFGMWSPGHGLLRRSDSPADGQSYFDLAARCDVLVEHIQTYCQRLPFRLEDNRELWLFDSDNKQPLALLASARADTALPVSTPDEWSCTIDARGSRIQKRFAQAAELELQVKRRAGSAVNKYWIRRTENGDGIVEAGGEHFSANRFPALLLEENWQFEEEQQRVQEYIKWISPSLLTLQHLDKATRTRIENSLHVQAVSIEHHWHLYPEVINNKLLKAARVQSRIVQRR